MSIYRRLDEASCVFCDRQADQVPKHGHLRAPIAGCPMVVEDLFCPTSSMYCLFTYATVTINIPKYIANYKCK